MDSDKRRVALWRGHDPARTQTVALYAAARGPSLPSWALRAVVPRGIMPLQCSVQAESQPLALMWLFMPLQVVIALFGEVHVGTRLAHNSNWQHEALLRRRCCVEYFTPCILHHCLLPSSGTGHSQAKQAHAARAT